MRTFSMHYLQGKRHGKRILPDREGIFYRALPRRLMMRVQTSTSLLPARECRNL